MTYFFKCVYPCFNTDSLQKNKEFLMIFPLLRKVARVGRNMVQVGTQHHDNQLKIPHYLCLRNSKKYHHATVKTNSQNIPNFPTAPIIPTVPTVPTVPIVPRVPPVPIVPSSPPLHTNSQSGYRPIPPQRDFMCTRTWQVVF